MKIDINLIIQKLNNSKIKSRKLTLNDLMIDDNYSILNNESSRTGKVRSYRMQGEYGTKKFIKP